MIRGHVLSQSYMLISIQLSHAHHLWRSQGICVVSQPPQVVPLRLTWALLPTKESSRESSVGDDCITSSSSLFFPCGVLGNRSSLPEKMMYVIWQLTMSHCGALQGRHLFLNFPFLHELCAVSLQFAIFLSALAQENNFFFLRRIFLEQFKLYNMLSI